MRRVCLVLVVFGLGCPTLNAQSQLPIRAPAFEVASIKPNRSGSSQASLDLQIGDRYTVTNTTLRALIRGAYELRDYQLIGGPDWVGTERFDVTAKAEDGTFPQYSGFPSPAMQRMVQNLLADRFRLVVHPETRQLPIYVLTLARPDRRLGPQLRPATSECAEATAAASGGLAKLNERLACSLVSPRPGFLAGKDLPIAQLAGVLGGFLRREVVDRTELAGDFALELQWTPDQAAPASVPDPSAPSLFTALQEQLGLKLESTRGPVQVLVIDHIEPPSPD